MVRAGFCLIGVAAYIGRVSLRIRPDLDDLPVYVPGKTFPGAVKLASNEVTEGPLPSVVEAIGAAAAAVNRYPDNGMVELTAALAKSLGVTEDEVQVGCGSVILCQNLILVTSGPGDEVVFGWRSFETYPLATRVAGATPVQVPLTGDLTYDLRAMADAITDRTRLIFVCNPNNPTGTVVEAADLREFLQNVPSDVIVALDEAYFEYLRLPSSQAYDALELRREFRNLVVLRTFSKAYGLAGLRVGYAIADPEVITALGKVHVPFSVSSVAQAAALASLDAGDQFRLGAVGVRHDDAAHAGAGRGRDGGKHARHRTQPPPCRQRSVFRAISRTSLLDASPPPRSSWAPGSRPTAGSCATVPPRDRSSSPRSPA